METYIPRGSFSIMCTSAVCTTELGAASVNQGEFDKRNVKLIGLSANDVNSHNEWIKVCTRYTFRHSDVLLTPF